jgi:hypothetical protein
MKETVEIKAQQIIHAQNSEQTPDPLTAEHF